ncbi:MAG: hypothetical protein CMJ67_10610 [Planctomycetaceae bacterium]|nr:hypothetical protein [Planctomycetaceae bacterium]
MTEEEAKARLLPPVQKGALVVVVRGRKVPRGTMGVVRWEGDGDYGPRVGLAVEGEDKLVYTAYKNVDAVYPGLMPGQDPEGGWVELYERVQREQRLPMKGHRIEHRDSGMKGKVFWAQGSRIGFKSDKGVTNWSDAHEVWMLSGPMECRLDYVTEVPAVPALRVLLEVDARSLPAPFNEIQYLDALPQGGYRGLNGRREYVATLPEEVAQQHLMVVGHLQDSGRPR